MEVKRHVKKNVFSLERDYSIKYQVPCGGFSLRKKCKHSDSLSCLKVWNSLLKNNLSDNDAYLLLNFLNSIN